MYFKIHWGGQIRQTGQYSEIQLPFKDLGLIFKYLGPISFTRQPYIFKFQACVNPVLEGSIITHRGTDEVLLGLLWGLGGALPQLLYEEWVL